MAEITWHQWISKESGDLYITGGITTLFGGPMVVGFWMDPEWCDITNAAIPLDQRPNEMFHVAMWSELPEPDLLLLEEKKKNAGQTRTSNAPSG